MSTWYSCVLPSLVIILYNLSLDSQLSIISMKNDNLILSPSIYGKYFYLIDFFSKLVCSLLCSFFTKSWIYVISLTLIQIGIKLYISCFNFLKSSSSIGNNTLSIGLVSNYFFTSLNDLFKMYFKHYSASFLFLA